MVIRKLQRENKTSQLSSKTSRMMEKIRVEKLKSRREKKHTEGFAPPITDINVTPLVDICLVLVIILLTFAPLIYLSGITVTRAKAAKNPERYSATELKVNVFITADGTVVLNDKVVDDEKTLRYLIHELLLRSLNRTVTISADPMVKHERVVWLLDLAKDEGAVTLCILKRRATEETTG
jgi:biopolymer transport protein ExbD